MRSHLPILTLSLIVLSACELYPPTTTPDYTIKVVPSNGGLVAIPPTCPSWVSDTTDPYDNQPVPQFGCANARNLAIMVDRPEDLVKGHDMGDGRAAVAVGGIKRYDNNQTRGLIYPSSSVDDAVDVTTLSTPNSAMTGDAASGSGAAASSSSGTPAAP